MSMWSWLYPDRTDTVTPLIDVDERGTGPAPCCAHLEQRLREVDEARGFYLGQVCDLRSQLNDLRVEHMAELGAMVAGHREALAEAEACIAELTAALDRDRPAPDRDALAADLRRAYWAAVEGKPEGLLGSTTATGIDRSGWIGAADTAIDTCRGLRSSARQCPRCDHDVEALPPGRVCDECADPADTAAVDDVLPDGWEDAQGASDDERCAASRRAQGSPTWWYCTRGVGHNGQHVATAGGIVAAVWPAAAPAKAGGESPGSGATSPDPAPGGLRWGTWGKAAEVLREIGTDIDLGAPVGAMAASMLRSLATDLDALHKRPDQRPVIAAILVAHELLADGTCRCGWCETDCPMPAGCPDSELWHAEHVAAQIVGTGVIAP